MRSLLLRIKSYELIVCELWWLIVSRKDQQTSKIIQRVASHIMMYIDVCMFKCMYGSNSTEPFSNTDNPRDLQVDIDSHRHCLFSLRCLAAWGQRGHWPSTVVVLQLLMADDKGHKLLMACNLSLVLFCNTGPYESTLGSCEDWLFIFGHRHFLNLGALNVHRKCRDKAKYALFIA